MIHNQDIDNFNEMIADCYKVFVGTKRTIRLIKDIFNDIDFKSQNIVLYEIESTARTEKKLALVVDKKLKIDILKELKIL